MKDNKTVDFLIVPDSLLREERGCVLLCEELKKRGYRAKILSSSNGIWRRYKKKVRVLVKNARGYVYSHIAETVYSVVGPIDKCVALQWEQVMNKGYRWELMNSSMLKTTNIMCWGKAFYKTNTDECHVNDEYLHLVGPIHLDFLRKCFRSTYISRESLCSKYGLDPQKKILLFMADGRLGIQYSKALWNATKNRFQNALIADEEKEYWEKTTDVIIDWIERLLKDYPDLQLVFRQHPATKIDTRLIDLNNRYKQFFLISSLPLQQWIIASDLCATVRSTSVVEAHFAGVPCIVLRPYEMNPFLDYQLYENLSFTKSYDDFSDNICNAKGVELDAGLLQYYYDISDTPSYIRICDELEKILKETKYNTIWSEDDIDGVKREYADHKAKETYNQNGFFSIISNSKNQLRDLLSFRKKCYRYELRKSICSVVNSIDELDKGFFCERDDIV